MLNITTAKPLLIEVDKQIKASTKITNECFNSKEHMLGLDIANHIGELKELRYQLSMYPERVIYITEDYLKEVLFRCRLKGI